MHAALAFINGDLPGRLSVDRALFYDHLATAADAVPAADGVQMDMRRDRRGQNRRAAINGDLLVIRNKCNRIFFHSRYNALKFFR